MTHIFEKAINVHYLDFQNKLNPSQRAFFYLEANEEAQRDWDLAKFWHRLSSEALFLFWSRVEAQENNLLIFLKNYKYVEDTINEEEEGSCDSEKGRFMTKGQSQLKAKSLSKSYLTEIFKPPTLGRKVFDKEEMLQQDPTTKPWNDYDDYS